MYIVKTLFVYVFLILSYLGCCPTDNADGKIDCDNLAQSKINALEKAISDSSVNEIGNIFNVPEDWRPLIKNLLDNLEHQNKSLKTLAFAVRYGDEDTVARIIKKDGSKIDLNSIFITSEAIDRANEKIIKILIDNNVKFEPYQLVRIAQYNTDAMKLLIEENNLDLNSEHHGWSVLDSAIVGKKHKAIKYLIEKGANVNSRTKSQETPLMIAAERLDIEAIKLLLDAGADKDLKDKNGHTASMKAWRDKNVQNFINNYIKHVAD